VFYYSIFFILCHYSLFFILWSLSTVLCL
jgi:hypothetical protein